MHFGRPGAAALTVQSIPRGTMDKLGKNAEEAADILSLLANGKRLTIVEHLLENEMSVGAIAKKLSLSQSALSQHLARMREEGLVAFRRDGQSLWYRIADPRIDALLASLERVFCRTGK